jgi:hypothetical protein
MDELLFLETCAASRRSSQMIAEMRDRVAASREAIVRTRRLLQSLKVYPYDPILPNTTRGTLSTRPPQDTR